jgi:serine/threonine-protein kinase
VPGDYESASIGVLSLSDRKRKTLLPYAGMYPQYVAGGYVTYISKGTLFAAPFDVDRLEILAQAKPVVEGVVTQRSLGYAQIDFSHSGTWLYRQGRADVVGTLSWINRLGTAEPVLGSARTVRAAAAAFS